MQVVSSIWHLYVKVSYMKHGPQNQFYCPKVIWSYGKYHLPPGQTYILYNPSNTAITSRFKYFRQSCLVAMATAITFYNFILPLYMWVNFTSFVSFLHRRKERKAEPVSMVRHLLHPPHWPEFLQSCWRRASGCHTSPVLVAWRWSPPLKSDRWWNHDTVGKNKYTTHQDEKDIFGQTSRLSLNASCLYAETEWLRSGKERIIKTFINYFVHCISEQ